MIYTSYFSHMVDIPEGFIPVSIALSKPKFYTGLEYKKLALDYKLLNDFRISKDTTRFMDCYHSKVLDRLTIHGVLTDLLILTNSYDICLLCWESSEKFCHRHLVRNWLADAGVRCEELL